jgi:hypothetical protein
MVDSTLVRVVIIPIYLVIVIFTVFLLWKNSAASDSLKNCGILVASLLPILIAVLPYLNSQGQKNTYTYVLFYDNVTKKIVSTGSSTNAYARVYRSLVADLKKEDLQAESHLAFMSERGQYIIEKSIITDLIFSFSQLWNYRYVEHTLPSWQAESHKTSDLPDIKIPVKKIKQEFSQNPLIEQLNTQVITQISLPANSTLNRDKGAIKINNPQFSIEIQVPSSMAGPIHQNVPEIIEWDSKDPYRYYMIAFLVTVTMKSKAFHKYSPQMPEYQGFYDNICRVLSAKDWNIVQGKIEKSLLDKAINKILEPK